MVGALSFDVDREFDAQGNAQKRFACGVPYEELATSGDFNGWFYRVDTANISEGYVLTKRCHPHAVVDRWRWRVFKFGR